MRNRIVRYGHVFERAAQTTFEKLHVQHIFAVNACKSIYAPKTSGTNHPPRIALAIASVGTFLTYTQPLRSDACSTPPCSLDGLTHWSQTSIRRRLGCSHHRPAGLGNVDSVVLRREIPKATGLENQIPEGTFAANSRDYNRSA